MRTTSTNYNMSIALFCSLLVVGSTPVSGFSPAALGRPAVPSTRLPWTRLLASAEIHTGYCCDVCGMDPIVGPRFSSVNVEGFDICGICATAPEQTFSFGGVPFSEMTWNIVSAVPTGAAAAAAPAAPSAKAAAPPAPPAVRAAAPPPPRQPAPRPSPPKQPAPPKTPAAPVAAAAPPAVRQVRTGYVDAPPDVREGQMFPDKPSGSLNELYSGSGGVSLHFGGLSLALSVVTLIVLLPFVGL